MHWMQGAIMLVDLYGKVRSLSFHSFEVICFWLFVSYRLGLFGKDDFLNRFLLCLLGDIGDIEDFGAVVTCPYHSYKITLKSGERLYKDLTGNLKVAGKRQRTHKVKVLFRFACPPFLPRRQFIHIAYNYQW